MHSSSFLIELHYLPCIEYVSYIYHCKEIHIEKHENFLKQSYRNRCRIRGANKVEDLIIPVKKSGNKKITDVEIDYAQKWMGVHQRAIMSAYGKSPYFEYFAEDILQIFRKRHKWLFELNLELLTKCLALLRIDFRIYFTDSFDKLAKNVQIDLRGIISPKKEQCVSGGFKAVEYPQVFGNNFVENLSILDLLFCAANDAHRILKNSLDLDKNRIRL